MTNTNQQEQLYRWVNASERLPEQYKSVPIRPNGLDQYFATAFYDGKVIWVKDRPNRLAEISEIEWLEPYTPPVEDGKQGGEVGMSVEDVLADIISIRNKLYEDLPTGEMNAFELLQTIKWHINELDNYCTTLSTYKSQPSTPVQDGCKKHEL